MAISLTALGLGGCDQGEPALDTSRGPALHVVATFPAPGTGTDCQSAPNCEGVPLNTDIELRFDRYLDPASAIRQSVLLYSTTPDGAIFLQPEYDVIERVVRFRLFENDRLQPSTLYTFEFVTPTDDSSGGFRAFDGAPIEAGDVPLKFNFFTGTADETKPAEPAVPDCRQILNLFRGDRAGCSGCHVSTPEGRGGCDPGQAPDPSTGECIAVPRQGLDLSTLTGVERTALNQVAHQTQIGPNADTPLENPGRVGVQMPIIDQQRPENSYMMYKLLRNESNFIDGAAPGTSNYRVALPGGNLAPDAAERDRLREWFVRLDPMPAQGFSLELSELRALQAWIRAGADLDACKP
ncbi:MAG: Ig-like domain-containing protein [Polyangiaceae bacterium]|nr:Ig-like domain-containing protein [Polyangiaceae bacterium]